MFRRLSSRVKNRQRSADAKLAGGKLPMIEEIETNAVVNLNKRVEGVSMPGRKVQL